MNAMRKWWTLGAVVLLVGVVGPRGTTAPTPTPKGPPEDEAVVPAIDPDKLAGSAELREADARSRAASLEKLKLIAQAFHNYAAINDSRLPGDILGKDGKQLLSWRVRVLPWLGEKKLYDQFRLDEPWDSKHNLPLMAKMPRVFESPRAKLKGRGMTVYQMFSGSGALFNRGNAKYGIVNIPDGTSNTILVVESSVAVPWTKPADIPYDTEKPIPDFGRAYGSKPLGVLADGYARVLDLKKISVKTLRHAIQPDDGYPLGPDWNE
jgi:hypothetical protein